MPIARLAEAGKLRDEQVLLAQTRAACSRTKRSPTSLREFFGQWLGYRSFLEQESVDRTVFKDFDDAAQAGNVRRADTIGARY